VSARTLLTKQAPSAGAMPRYFFHIKDKEETIRDEEGIELHGLDAVHEEVTESAREMMSDDVRQGSGPDGRTFVVTDEQGQTVLTFPFKDAISD
jgi:hypothetical protein